MQSQDRISLRTKLIAKCLFLFSPLKQVQMKTYQLTKAKCLSLQQSLNISWQNHQSKSAQVLCLGAFCHWLLNLIYACFEVGSDLQKPVTSGALSFFFNWSFLFSLSRHTNSYCLCNVKNY